MSGTRDGTELPQDDYEYAPLRLDPAMSRSAATTMLTIQAEYSGWELARVLRFSDGSRRVWLRRKRPRGMVPGLTA
ncbi:MAG: DUF5703 family protein [Nakamurella sp.]